MLNDDHTIVAPSTPAGGAIALIRLSGKDAIEICDKVFRSPNGRNLTSARGFTLHYGEVVDAVEQKTMYNMANVVANTVRERIGIL